MIDPGVPKFWMLAVLAQAPRTPPSQVFMVVGLLIGAAVVLGLVILLVRRKMLGGESASAQQSGLMDQLRRLRDSGELTPEEYDAARKSMVSRMTGAPSKPAKGTDE